LLGRGKLLLQKAEICPVPASRSFVALVFCPDQGSRSADPLALACFRQIAAWMGRILARLKRAEGTIRLFLPISRYRFPDLT
jgi:hypothetical protein